MAAPTEQVPYTKATDQAYKHYLQKIEKRAQTFQYSGGVIHHNLIHRQLCTFSRMLYVAAQRQPSEAAVKSLQKAQGELLGLNGLSQADAITPVLRAIGATMATTIDAVLDRALIKACIRQHSYTALITPGEDQQTNAAAGAFDILGFERLGGDARSVFLNQAASKSKHVICDMVAKTVNSITLDKARNPAKHIFSIFAKTWYINNSDEKVAKATDCSSPIRFELYQLPKGCPGSSGSGGMM